MNSLPVKFVYLPISHLPFILTFFFLLKETFRNVPFEMSEYTFLTFRLSTTEPSAQVISVHSFIK